MSAQEPIPFLDLKAQHARIRTEIDAAISGVVDRCDFVKGQAVQQFETAFARYQGAKECIAVANGTDALEIALEALELPPGSEVIVPSNSFIATSEAVTRSGYEVVFADVDETYTLDPDSVASLITDRTAAVVVVHLYGQPANMTALVTLCRANNLRLIEDAAQAHGAEVTGRRVGAIGDIGTFSFFPGKNLGAFGDAGAIVTDDPELAAACRRLADHGRISKYDHDREGRNSRMDTIQAAVLQVKLAHLDSWLEIRRRCADTYRQLIADAFGPLSIPAHGNAEWGTPCGPGEVRLSREVATTTHSYHLFVVRVAERDRVRDFLSDRGVATGIHYPIALPRLGAYANHPQHDAPFRCVPWAGELVSLPIGDHMTDERVARVVEELVDSTAQLEPPPA